MGISFGEALLIAGASVATREIIKSATDKTKGQVPVKPDGFIEGQLPLFNKFNEPTHAQPVETQDGEWVAASRGRSIGGGPMGPLLPIMLAAMPATLIVGITAMISPVLTGALAVAAVAGVGAYIANKLTDGAISRFFKGNKKDADKDEPESDGLKAEEKSAAGPDKTAPAAQTKQQPASRTRRPPSSRGPS